MKPDADRVHLAPNALASTRMPAPSCPNKEPCANICARLACYYVLDRRAQIPTHAPENKVCDRNKNRLYSSGIEAGSQYTFPYRFVTVARRNVQVGAMYKPATVAWFSTCLLLKWMALLEAQVGFDRIAAIHRRLGGQRFSGLAWKLYAK